MFCKIKMSRYLVTFMNDNNVTMIFNIIDWILAPNQLLCWMLFSDKLMTTFSWWWILLLYCRALVELCYDHSENSTDLTAQWSRFLFLSMHSPTKLAPPWKDISAISGAFRISASSSWVSPSSSLGGKVARCYCFAESVSSEWVSTVELCSIAPILVAPPDPTN